MLYSADMLLNILYSDYQWTVQEEIYVQDMTTAHKELKTLLTTSYTVL
jgi:hypothetical protein